MIKPTNCILDAFSCIICHNVMLNADKAKYSKSKHMREQDMSEV